MRAKTVNFERNQDPRASLDVGKYRGMSGLPIEIKDTILLLRDTGYWKPNYDKGIHIRTEDQGMVANQFFWDYSKQEKQYSYQGARLLWSSLIWIDWRAPVEFEDNHMDIVSLMDEADGFPSFEGSVQIQKIDPNSDAAEHHGGSIKAEVSVRTDDDSVEFPDSYEVWFSNPEDVAPFIAKKLKEGETYIKRALNRKYKHLFESVNFERGQDPKKSLQVGRASRVNYFRDNLEGISYKKYIEEVEDFPWNQGKDILRVAAKLLDIPEKDVQIAVEYDNEPLTTARIEEHIEGHEWQYDLDETIGDFDLIKTETGELYVFPAGEQEDPYAILGSPF